MKLAERNFNFLSFLNSTFFAEIYTQTNNNQQHIKSIAYENIY